MSLTVRKLLDAAIPGMLLIIVSQRGTIVAAPSQSAPSDFYLSCHDESDKLIASNEPIPGVRMAMNLVFLGFDVDAQYQEIVRTIPTAFDGYTENPIIEILSESTCGAWSRVISRQDHCRVVSP